jgi:hypothetical protein
MAHLVASAIRHSALAVDRRDRRGFSGDGEFEHERQSGHLFDVALRRII